MSIAASALSIWTQGLQLASVPNSHLVRSWPERLAAAGHAIWFYFGKLLWPHPLVAIYPNWEINAGRHVSYLPLLAAVILFISLLWLLRSRSDDAAPRACLFAFTYFIIALLPVLGFVGNQIFHYSLVFDHFQYLAGMGPLALAGAGLAWSWEKRIGVSAYRRIGVAAEISQDKLVTWMDPAQRGWRAPNKESLSGLRDLLCRFFFAPLARIANQPRILASKIPWLRPALCAALLLILGLESWQRTWVYRSEETLWSDTVAKNPNSWLGHGELGLVFFQKGQFDEAIRQYQIALEINPNDTLAHVNLGNALSQDGRLGEGIEQYRLAVKINPKMAEAHYNLGMALFHRGQLDDAITQYQEALEIDPSYAEAHFNLGSALLQLGRVDEAIEQYQMALKINPDYLGIYVSLGRILFQKGQLDTAIELYQMVIKINPQAAEALNDLGAALYQKGQLDDAIAKFQMALKINSNYAEAHINLGDALFQKGRLDDAIEQYQTVVRINANYAEAHNSLGVALYQKGQLDDAIAQYHKALEINPKFAVALGNLGAAYFQKGQLEDAIIQLQKALQLNPDLTYLQDNLAEAQALLRK
jgi:tetratricopeptide (TPR) repeat protein